MNIALLVTEKAVGHHAMALLNEDFGFKKGYTVKEFDIQIKQHAAIYVVFDSEGIYTTISKPAHIVPYDDFNLFKEDFLKFLDKGVAKIKDTINPSHYKQYPIESIDMMISIWGKQKVRDFCIMNAFKYRMRLGHKDNIEQELAKEKWYLDKAKELE